MRAAREQGFLVGTSRWDVPVPQKRDGSGLCVKERAGLGEGQETLGSGASGWRRTRTAQRTVPTCCSIVAAMVFHSTRASDPGAAGRSSFR